MLRLVEMGLFNLCSEGIYPDMNHPNQTHPPFDGDGRDPRYPSRLAWMGVVSFGAFAGGAAVAFLLFVIFGVLGLNWPIFQKFAIFGSRKNAALEDNEIISIMDLVQKGHVTSIDNIISNTMGYYDTIIVVLITIIGLVSAASYLYIRSASRFYIEDVLHERIERTTSRFFESGDFQKIVENEVGTTMDAAGATLQSLSDLRDSLENLKGKLESHIAQLDSVEETEGDIEINEPPVPQQG